MPNKQLLQDTMQYILDNPDRHDQTVWVCGTAACFAGTGALLVGWSPFMIEAYMSTPAGARLFGITPMQAQLLFNAHNTIPMLQLMVKDLVDGVPMRDITEYRIQSGT